MAAAAEQARSDPQWDLFAQSEPEIEFDQSAVWCRVIFARHGRLLLIQVGQRQIDEATRGNCVRCACEHFELL
jgi:hypothetical protein